MHAVDANVAADSGAHLEAFWERLDSAQVHSVDQGIATAWQVRS